MIRMYDMHIDKRINNIIQDDLMVGGKAVETFEKKYAEYTETKYAIGVSSGTMALSISLRALEIYGDVLTTPVTFQATPKSIMNNGNRPIFCDIQKDTWNIDPIKMGEKIAGRVNAIMPVHLFGLPCDRWILKELAENNGLKMIEDSCQAHGLKKTVGDCSCWSFYPTKNLDCNGNGGMITTDNKELADKMRLLRQHGDEHTLGFNGRMNTVNAVIGNWKLMNIQYNNNMRKRIAQEYLEKLNGVVTLPYHSNDHVWHQFTIRTKNRNKLKEYLYKKGIETAIYYPKALNTYPIFKANGICTNAVEYCRECLSLPIHPKITIEDIETITKHIKKFFN